jgi:hypothetical protein
MTSEAKQNFGAEKSLWQMMAEERVKQLGELIDLQQKVNEIKRVTLDLKNKIPDNFK